jgi:uncharacterized membrane protein
MSFYWLLFASLSVLGSLFYNIGVKFSSANVNAFGFAFTMNCVVLFLQTIVVLTAKYGFRIDVAQGMNKGTVKFAVMAGLGAAIIDVSYFFANRYGSVIASQLFWTIGGIIALAVFSALFLGETITPTKAAGIILGIVAVFLITGTA